MEKDFIPWQMLPLTMCSALIGGLVFAGENDIDKVGAKNALLWLCCYVAAREFASVVKAIRQ